MFMLGHLSIAKDIKKEIMIWSQIKNISYIKDDRKNALNEMKSLTNKISFFNPLMI